MIDYTLVGQRLQEGETQWPECLKGATVCKLCARCGLPLSDARCPECGDGVYENLTPEMQAEVDRIVHERAQRQQLLDHLERATEIVKSWPAWKQEILD